MILLNVQVLAGIFAVSGTVHLVKPELYEPIMPTRLPAHRELILGSGVAELALAAGLLWPAVMSQHARTFRDVPDVQALHRLQVGWRAEQMESLRRYFDRTGTEHDGCPGGWPVIPTPTVQDALDGVA